MTKIKCPKPAAQPPGFALEHYQCAICGDKSSNPDALCVPVKKEFQQ